MLRLRLKQCIFREILIKARAHPWVEHVRKSIHKITLVRPNIFTISTRTWHFGIKVVFLSLVIGYDNNTIPYLTVTPTPMVMLFLQKIKFQKNNPIACYSIWNQGSLRKLSLIISLLLSGTRIWMNSRIVLVVNFVESFPQIDWRKVGSTRYHCLLSKS